MVPFLSVKIQFEHIYLTEYNSKANKCNYNAVEVSFDSSIKFRRVINKNTPTRDVIRIVKEIIFFNDCVKILDPTVESWRFVKILPRSGESVSVHEVTQNLKIPNFMLEIMMTLFNHHTLFISDLSTI